MERWKWTAKIAVLTFLSLMVMSCIRAVWMTLRNNANTNATLLIVYSDRPRDSVLAPGATSGRFRVPAATNDRWFLFIDSNGCLYQYRSPDTVALNLHPHPGRPKPLQLVLQPDFSIDLIRPKAWVEAGFYAKGFPAHPIKSCP